jgi:RNA polymerase sigma-70 factor (ECF subfamily)
MIGDSNGKARTTSARSLSARTRSCGSSRACLRCTSRAPSPLGGRCWNGDLGVYLPAAPATGGYRARDARVQTTDLRDGKIVTIYDVANPDKLTRVTQPSS